MKSFLRAYSVAVAFIAAFASAPCCEARHFLANQSSYLNFHIPAQLHHENSWPHVPASFGRFGQGTEGSITLPVKMVHRKDQFLCNEDNNAVAILEKLHIPADSGAPFILLVERGQCTYVKKVRNAQKLGAAAVLIGDPKNNHLPFETTEDILFLDSDPRHNTTQENHTEHENSYRLADDGSGEDISIPSMMIGKKEYESIRAVIDAGANETGIVVAEISWHVPKFDSKVVMELWSSPADWHVKQFLASNFSTIARSFDLNEMHGNTHENESYNEDMNLMRFKERPILLDGIALGCLGNTKAPDEPCYHLCTNGGRYCHASHHGNLGRDIVKESLRRLCIDKHYKSAKVYWDYIDHFNNFCWETDFFAAEKCIDDAFKHSNIEKSIIESCFSDSGNPDEDEANALLQDSLDMIKKRGVYKSPTVMINHEPSMILNFEGLSPRPALYALCQTFSYGKKPHVCYACETCGDPIACANRSPMKCLASDGQEKEDKNAHKDHSHHKGKKKKGRHVLHGFFWLLVIGGSVGGFIYYKKYMEENGGDGLGRYTLQDAFLSDTS